MNLSGEIVLKSDEASQSRPTRDRNETEATGSPLDHLIIPPKPVDEPFREPDWLRLIEVLSDWED